MVKLDLPEREYINYANGSNADKEELLQLVDRIWEVDPKRKSLIDKIKMEFPIPNIIKISGAKEAIDTFKSIDIHKTDIDLALKDITNIDFVKFADGSDEYKLYFSTLSPAGKIAMDGVTTIYNATSTFLDQYMSLSKAAKFALHDDEKVVLLKLIKEYQSNVDINKKINKLRFIDIGDATYLRAVVSSNYKLYDNDIVLYMAMSVICDVASKMNKKFELSHVKATESKFFATFFEEDRIQIRKNVYLQVGLRVQNSELGDGAAKFQTIYKIQNHNGKNSFTVIRNELSSIYHDYNPYKIAVKLQKLHDFDQEISDMKKAVSKISWDKQVTRESLNYVAHKISSLRKGMSKELKEEIINKIDAADITKKTFTIAKLFNQLDSFMLDKGMDAQVAFESNFAKWLREINRQIKN